MRADDTLTAATIARTVGPSDRRWIPAVADPDELVATHRNLRGGGLSALARVVGSPIVETYVAARAGEVVEDGFGRILAEIEEGPDA